MEQRGPQEPIELRLRGVIWMFGGVIWYLCAWTGTRLQSLAWSPTKFSSSGVPYNWQRGGAPECHKETDHWSSGFPANRRASCVVVIVVDLCSMQHSSKQNDHLVWLRALNVLHWHLFCEEGFLWHHCHVPYLPWTNGAEEHDSCLLFGIRHVTVLHTFSNASETVLFQSKFGKTACCTIDFKMNSVVRAILSMESRGRALNRHNSINIVMIWHLKASLFLTFLTSASSIRFFRCAMTRLPLPMSTPKTDKNCDASILGKPAKQERPAKQEDHRRDTEIPSWSTPTLVLINISRENFQPPHNSDHPSPGDWAGTRISAKTTTNRN